ncbi:MAG: TrbI/VirB10 family protein, partial [Acidobacteriaceae bacterium]
MAASFPHCQLVRRVRRQHQQLSCIFREGLRNGCGKRRAEAYQAGIASSLSQSSANVLNKFINIPPTITIREGHRIKVYITQDMLLPA